MQIRQLPPGVVNKIAAGEVIERPASVVKELVENSLDAGATRIDVSIEKGGAELIRVTDNGCGVPAEQLLLATTSHATSKISDADDLFRVATLGFRGEALASIAAVSRLSFRSRPADAESGAVLELAGGRNEPIRPIGCPRGTSVEVQNLFFNTPVRHKFLRTAQTEMGHLAEAVTRLALAHQRVHFTLTHGNRLIHDLPPAADLQTRVAALFGEPLASALIPIDATDGDVRIFGYVANPTQSRGNNRMQYLFLNGRFIRDRALQHALGEAYRGLLLTGRYPICFLHLEMPPAQIDVNVHPTKIEVRFQDGGRLYSQLLGALRTKFLSTDLVAQGELPAASAPDGELGAAGPAANELFDWARRQLAPASEATPSFRPFPSDVGEPRSGPPLQLHRVDLPPSKKEGASAAAAPLPVDDRPEAVAMGPNLARAEALQIHNRYLVAESADGLEIIDQHALHERILYEALREKVLAGALETQKMLVPEPVDVAAQEAAVVLENRELLSQLGVETEPFGGETILVSAYPAMLAKLAPREILSSLIEHLLAAGKQPETRDLLDELLHMMACKAAVKYGDPLEPEEIKELLAQRHLARDHHHCPHGRPTTLVFTREQLDRQFQRT